MPETPQVDADFALVISGVQGSAGARGGDWDGSGRADHADVAAFLIDFTSGAADTDADGATTPADAFVFLKEFFAHPLE